MRNLGEHLDLPQISRANSVKWHSTYNESNDKAAKYAYAYTHAHNYIHKKKIGVHMHAHAHTHMYIFGHTNTHMHTHQLLPKKNPK